MKLTYSLDEQDYLAYLLFIASKSKKVRKQRIFSHVLLIFSFLLLAFSFYRTEKTLSYLFIILSIITAIFYPLYQRKRYKNHYVEHNKEYHKNIFNKESEIEITEEFITSKSYLGESKININVIDYITEISDYIFIKINSGSSFIIPKRIENIENIKVELKQLTKKINVDYIEDLNWKWK